jgi:hypothetical protein
VRPHAAPAEKVRCRPLVAGRQSGVQGLQAQADTGQRWAEPVAAATLSPNRVTARIGSRRSPTRRLLRDRARLPQVDSAQAGADVVERSSARKATPAPGLRSRGAPTASAVSTSMWLDDARPARAMQLASEPECCPAGGARYSTRPEVIMDSTAPGESTFSEAIVLAQRLRHDPWCGLPGSADSESPGEGISGRPPRGFRRADAQRNQR